jgi:PDZ domain-containing secreted protein
VLTVDAVNGNDSIGTVNGPSFLTVEAAISYINSHSLTSVTVWVLPGTYNLSSGITIPNSCSIRGISLQTTRIALSTSNPGGTVTMLTMGENTRVEDITFTLSSSNATTNLVGIHLPGTTSVTSKVRTCVITVDNSGV